jgi:ABC-type multidrug transport system ATPase subunit
MKGTIRIGGRKDYVDFELPRKTTFVTKVQGGRWHIHDQPQDQSALAIHWDSRKSGWALDLNESSLEILLNGAQLPSAGEAALNDLDIVEFSDTWLQFQRTLEEPRMAGTPVSEIRLGKEPTVFGSARDSTTDATRINLDAEDLRISRIHAVITQSSDSYFIEDKSSLGTELNGVAFQREKLVYGDRFRISGYIFEYNGETVRRICPEHSGALLARNLVKVAEGRRILDGVTLNIPAGEFVGVLGRSGQGKSTFLTAICGISPTTSGEASIGEVPLTDRKRLRDIGIGYVPQDDIVHRELTVRDAVTLSAKLRLELKEHFIKSLVDRTLDRLDLTTHAHKRIALLSGGQRKRVSIAIELLSKPTVLFLDEPSSGLDPATEAELMTLLQSLTLTKLTVVCTTHVLHKAYLFDRIIVIEGGKLIFAGSGDEARSHFLSKDSGSMDTSLEKAPLEKIYSLLQQNDREGGKTPADWEHFFTQSNFGSRACPPLPDAGVRLKGYSRKGVSTFKTLVILMLRQWRILHAAPLNIAFLAVQPILIGFFIGWACDESALRMFLCIVATMWFGCSNGAQQIISEISIFRRERVCGQSLNAYILSKVAFLSAISLLQAGVLLFSTLSVAHFFHSEGRDYENIRADFVQRLAAQSPIARETSGGAIFDAVGTDELNSPTSRPSTPRPENTPPLEPPRPSTLRVYLLTYTAEFFGITQNLLDSGPRIITASDGSPVRDAEGREILSPGLRVGGVLLTTLGLRLAAIAGAALVSVGIGLAISCLVENTTQAVLWVPLILIPQILFGGMVIRVPEMSGPVRRFSKMMPSYAAQRIADVSAVFAMDTPALSNRTKTPIFLSSLGEKETVTWEERGEQRSQDYDKISEVNGSWQNLVVVADRLGQHKWRMVSGGQNEPIYPDSVSQRRDVRIRKGMPYLDLTPFRSAALTLLAWVVICYAVLLMGLHNKQTGR